MQEALAKLAFEQENSIPSRFHCRAILVGTVAEYARLLNELKKLKDAHVFPIDDLFAGADIMPAYERLTGKEYQNQWLILPGVSEYLRLFHANEENAQRFGVLWHHLWDASTTGRILIPLWGCEALWHDRALGLCTDLRQEEYVFDCAGHDEPQPMNIQVLSGDFEQYVSKLAGSHGHAFCGLKEWYQFWYEPRVGTQNYLILTRRLRSIKPTDGAIRIHVVCDTLSFLRENLIGGAVLTEENCPKEAQECLIPSALQGRSVDEAILGALNAQTFRPTDVLGKWSAMQRGERQLLFLWYALYPDESYLCHCVGLCKNVDELGGKIISALFAARVNRPEWVQEARALIAAGALPKNDAYFQHLDEMATPEEKLSFLTDGTVRERVYILRLVGQWMRDDREAVMQSQTLKKTYPALCAYFEDRNVDEALKAYFARYKTHKLANTLPDDEEAHFEGIDTEAYDARYQALSDEVADGETFILWIDALGAEWLNLLTWALQTLNGGTVTSVRVAQANLPSETRYNEQWKQMDVPNEKYNKLDKLAHQGVVDDSDYYSCVEEQIRFVAGLAEKVDGLLGQYARVLITGDHGTSRLAARCFHRRNAIPAPENAEVGSHGRYCRIHDAASPLSGIQKVARDDEGNSYIVFTNYDHFPKSGSAAGAEDDNFRYGEIHGGATPEEMLVPVITVKSKNTLPLTAEWGMKEKSVKIQSKRVKCTVRFSRPVSSVKARMNDVEATCEAAQVPSKEWVLTFSGMNCRKTKQFDVDLIADGKIVPIEKLEIISALKEDELFGGGNPF